MLNLALGFNCTQRKTGVIGIACFMIIMPSGLNGRSMVYLILIFMLGFTKLHTWHLPRPSGWTCVRHVRVLFFKSAFEALIFLSIARLNLLLACTLLAGNI